MPPAAVARVLVLPFVCIWFQLDGAIALGCALGVARARTMLALSARETAGATLVAALLAAGLVAAIPQAWRNRRRPYALPPEAPPWVLAIERTATRYASPVSTKPTDRMPFQGVRTKLLGDPVARIVPDLATGTVLDVGCGRGALALLLLSLGRASRVHGIDWDEGKVAAAARAASGPGRDLRPRRRAHRAVRGGRHGAPHRSLALLLRGRAGRHPRARGRRPPAGRVPPPARGRRGGRLAERRLRSSRSARSRFCG
jgi:hypothetical protein